MAKRFVDTELDDKEWFMSLSCRLKCAVQHVFRKCDSAGIWEPNYIIASAYVGEGGFKESELLAIDNGQQFEKLASGKIFVVGFCDFQYGELTESCKPHRPIIQKLKKLDLFERVSKGYQKSIERVQEKDKDKEKEKEQDFGKSENLLLPPNPTPQGIVPEMQQEFKEANPEYPADQQKDFPALCSIAGKILKWQRLKGDITATHNAAQIKLRWGELVPFIHAEPFFSGYSLQQVDKHFQSIVQKFNSRHAKQRITNVGRDMEYD